MILLNAFKSITRAKGRNILIGIIVFTIAVSSSIALAIRSAANEAKETGMSVQTITGTISVDRQKIMGSSGQLDMTKMREMLQQYQSLSLSELQTYADSDYVKEFYYSASVSLNATGELEAYSTSSSSSNSGTSSGGMGGRGGMIGMGGMAMGDFSITGYSSESAMTKFISGESKITSGEVFDISSSEMNCVISNELALFNDLSVNDKITLANPNAEDETYEFTIVGIYTNASSNTGSTMMFSTAMDPANLICVSYNALSAIVEQSAAAAIITTDEDGNETTTAFSMQESGSYVFSTLENYNSFETEITAKGLSEYYTLSSSDINNYEASLVPLENLGSFATTLLIIVLIVGSVILVVLNVFNIRERKFEVGVLTAIGIKKGKVATQFVVELLAVTLIAICLGAGVGAIASVPVSNSLLESQISSQENTQNTQEQNFGRQGMMGQAGNFNGIFGNATTAVEYLDTIDATIDITILGQLIGIGIILSIISSLAGVVFVLRYEPLKILANRA